MIDARIVWCRSDDDLDLSQFAASLPQAERDELAGFGNSERRRSFVVSRLLLRRTLADILDMPAGDVPLQRDANGRLQLGAPTRCHISLSHSRSLVAIVVADAACGVDIEQPCKVDEMKLAQRYFSAAEARWLASCDEERRRLEFFRLWTLKEAAVKALGEGLANNLARLAFSLEQIEPRQLGEAPALKLWQTVAPDFVLAGAVATQDEVRWRCHEAGMADLARRQRP